jgi:para-aminobenzoate synthetase/4-amino-4-deoxychorismate lyase
MDETDMLARTLARQPWTADTSESAYTAAIARIKAYIAAGDTYQVNYTWRMMAEFAGDPWALFADLWRAQRAPYAAYMDAGDHVICSASPELFFARRGDTLTCRPMKGTAPRGLCPAADEASAAWLRASEKDRAENLMIVDMIRNDLGRIAETGSVHVASLFDVERYPTLWQMTSTVRARTGAGLTETFRALFPCASITGAPKVRTSEIIAELETSPRGVYCGAVGIVAPGGDAQFSVAIRTAVLHRPSGRLVYGTGSGVTWDSTATGEYDECRTKALVLTTARPAFRLLETLRWTPAGGYGLLEEHLARLAASARYFGFAWDEGKVREALALTPSPSPRGEGGNEAGAATAMGVHSPGSPLSSGRGAGGEGQSRRIRILLTKDGHIDIEAHPIQPRRRRWRVALAAEPVDSSDVFLYHKTTNRAVYEAARAARPDVDDVLLWNARGEITESTIANVVVRLDGRLVTPPVSCGLLAGTLRDWLLARGRVVEGIITREDLARAEGIYLVNSVRGWMPVELIDDEVL